MTRIDSLSNEPSSLTDVTEKFIQAANQLEIGEMIHSRDFSLQKTLTAVLVGDPFFDKTLASNVKKTCEENQNWIPCEKLDDNQLISLMYKFIAYFTSWLDGQSFFQTVYSCIYLRQLKSLNNMKLRNFLFMSVKACQLIDKCIIEAQVVEEEDFVLGQPLLESIVWSDMEADYLIAQQSILESSWKEPNRWNKPLQLFYYICNILDSNLNQSFEKSKQDIIAAKKTLADISVDASNVDLMEETLFGFDVCLQVSNYEIPRSTTPYTITMALQKLEHLLTEWEELIDWIRKYTLEIENSNHIFPLLCNIFSFNRSKRHIVTRSLLYSRCVISTTTWSRTIWLKNMGWKVWQSRSKDWNLDSISKVNHSIHLLDYLIQDLFHVLCLNRGKQRRKLLNLLSHVEQLYTQSIGKRETTQSVSGKEDNPLSLFIKELGYMISIQHLLLGFDCDLYDSSEYSAVYFVLGYLYECWSGIIMHSSSSLCWKSQQLRLLWESWIRLCSKLYRSSCLLLEWEQERKQWLWNKLSQTRQENLERNPLFIHPLTYEIRFSALTTCSFMQKIQYSLYYREIVEPISLCFSNSTIQNTLNYWLEPLQSSFESIKKTLEYMLKNDTFYFMISTKPNYFIRNGIERILAVLWNLVRLQ
ncbi:acetyltransferase [Galdieria sulphuraria]|uniref:Acetyltransferase n=1 Tax=Galdieria sulphuraria TaxID=130081 RepID=M2XX35_GALSU|nr:acetyltransferase [Galdieria sulphuraria]EME28188.1 acetyltransferase [Galdieria sulphuraria]|eukprot:XP_005704708.1 acetyltransferase [Galdieria sulphuraria]